MQYLTKLLITFSLFIISLASYADISAGLAAIEKGKTKDAISYFNASIENPIAKIELAKIYANSDLDKADELISEVINTNPDNPEAFYALGIIRGYQAQDAIFSALKLAKQSKGAFEKAVQLSPDNIDYVKGLFSFHLSAPSIAGGSKDEAFKLASKIAVLDPVSGVLAKVDYAKAYNDGKDIQLILEKGIEQHQESQQLLYQAGLFFQAEENFDEAFRYFTQAEKSVDPDDSIFGYAATYQIGRTSVFSQSNLGQGINALKQYIEHAPEHKDLVSKSWAKFRLALLLELNGEKSEAKAIYTKLLSSTDKNLLKKVKKKV